MNYHALSLADCGYTVDFVGIQGSKPLQIVLNNPKIHIHYLSSYDSYKLFNVRIFDIFVKVFLQLGQLLYTFASLPAYDRILVQTPPAIPTLFIARLLSWIRGAQLYIDWHNFGYTIMKVGAFKSWPIAITIAMYIEKYTGYFGDVHFCVTKAMQKWLYDHWNIKATVLHDQPSDIFQCKDTIRIQELHLLWHRLYKESVLENCTLQSYDDITVSSTSSSMSSKNTIYTTIDSEGNILERTDRPLIIVSGTSWTPDEDFSILLDALCQYDKLPNPIKRSILVIVTGKGPEKQKYVEIISNMHFTSVQICTAWLSAEDYPLLLASADLGVSLHYSSSGLDLPMKVVDMFGACLPAISIRFDCIHELVHDKVNGLLFSNANDLAHILDTLANPNDHVFSTVSIESMKDNLRKERPNRNWNVNWNTYALPLFKQ